LKLFPAIANQNQDHPEQGDSQAACLLCAVRERQGRMEQTMSRRWQSVSVRLSKVITVLLLAALPAVAQQPAPAATSANDQSKVEDKKTAEQKSDQKTDQKADPTQQSATSQQPPTSNDRLFYALPNFLTVENANQLPPLTAGQKFKLEARSQFDYIEIAWYAVLAGVSQAANSEPGYGQGAAGYGKRYGAAWGDGAIENFMTGAIFPSILRQDPRFYRLGKGSFWHRTRYAVGRIFITRGDSGKQQFNASEIFGSALAAGISTYSYHPRSDRTLDNTARVWGTQVGLDTFTFAMKEFWPDIRRKFSHKQQTTTPTP
jgi:hypothetical protein